MYDRGAVSSTDRWDHFCGEATGCSVPNAYDRPYHYTLQEQGSSFGASLYQLPVSSSAAVSQRRTPRLISGKRERRVAWR